MMKLISILFLILLMPETYISDWHLIPNDIKEDFNGLHFFDEKHGFAVTKQGSIYSFKLTKNQWEIEKTKFDYDLENIYFPDNGRRGFAFGTKGVILRTEDAGHSWVEDTIGHGYRFTDMVFFEPSKRSYSVMENKIGTDNPRIKLYNFAFDIVQKV